MSVSDLNKILFPKPRNVVHVWLFSLDPFLDLLEHDCGQLVLILTIFVFFKYFRADHIFEVVTAKPQVTLADHVEVLRSYLLGI